MNESTNLFSNLILSLAAAAMQQMGKIVNPLSGKTELDLPRAQQTIDLLDLLQAKTKGNLTDQEHRLLSHLTGDLKMNYIETLNAQKTTPPTPAQPAEKTAPTPEVTPPTPPETQGNT